MKSNLISDSLLEAIKNVSKTPVSNDLIQIEGYGKITRNQAHQKAKEYLDNASKALESGHHSSAYHHHSMAGAFIKALHTDKETSSI